MPRSHFNGFTDVRANKFSLDRRLKKHDHPTLVHVPDDAIQKFEYLLVGELALDHLTLSNRSADYINSFASIHVGIALVY